MRGEDWRSCFTLKGRHLWHNLTHVAIMIMMRMMIMIMMRMMSMIMMRIMIMRMTMTLVMTTKTKR